MPVMQNPTAEPKTPNVARIAMVALQELEDNKMLDFLLLKDDELRSWWIEQKERQQQNELVKSALNKLTKEERLALIKKILEKSDEIAERK